MTIEAPTRALFELTFDSNDQGDVTMRDEPKAIVRWCLTPELIEELEHHNALDKAKMLISVIHDRGKDEYERFIETKRYLVNLTQEMETVFFSASGTNLVRAMVVWPIDGNEKRLRKTILGSRSGRVYSTSMTWRDDGSSMNEYELRNEFNASRIGYEETYRVEVDDGVFPKRPTGLTLRILEKWSEQNTFDQCETREKLMWTIPLTLLTLIPAFLIKATIALLAAAVLCRNVDWSQLWKPLAANSIWDLSASVHFKLSAWFYKEPNPDGYWSTYGEARNFVWWLMNPYSVVVLGSLLFWVSHYPVYITGSETETVQWFFIGYWQSLAVVAAVQIWLTLISLIVVGGFFVADFIYDAGITQRLVKALPKRNVQKQVDRVHAEVEAMMCRPMPHEVDYQQIDRSKKSSKEKFRLRRSQIKSTKACSPYSRY